MSDSDPELRWRADPELTPALEALGWPARHAAEAAFAHAASAGRSETASAGRSETASAGRSETASAGRSETALLALPGRPERLHLRRVRHGGWLGPLWAGTLWGPERPFEEWQAHARLRAAGAPVPRPALVAAWRARGPLWTALYGTVHVEGARDGVRWLAEAPRAERVQAAARAVGTAVRRFHDAGGAHADLHLKNLLLRDEGEQLRAWVIDLDRARVGAPPPPARRMRELMRLLRSLYKRGVAQQVGARGRAAFFSAYCAGDRSLRAALLASRARELRRNRLHALGYRGVDAPPVRPAGPTRGD